MIETKAEQLGLVNPEEILLLSELARNRKSYFDLEKRSRGIIKNNQKIYRTFGDKLREEGWLFYSNTSRNSYNPVLIVAEMLQNQGFQIRIIPELVAFNGTPLLEDARAIYVRTEDKNKRWQWRHPLTRITGHPLLVALTSMEGSYSVGYMPDKGNTAYSVEETKRYLEDVEEDSVTPDLKRKILSLAYRMTIKVIRKRITELEYRLDAGWEDAKLRNILPKVKRERNDLNLGEPLSQQEARQLCRMVYDKFFANPDDPVFTPFI